jgi:signal transduction histidine kinase
LDMAAVISDTVSLAHGELQHYGVTVTYDFTEQLPSVPGDRVQLQQVMLNLVVNAIQAMAAVSDRPRVLTIGCKPQGDGVLITVEDTGTGFDEAVADRMFTSTFTTKSHGMGFGLAISRWIVAAHGGRIWATSGQGVGAVFHVALPSRRDAGDTGQA